MSSPRARYEISQIIQRFLPEVASKGRISGHQRSILKLISQCKTADLGGHKERCNQCGHVRIHYNSCGNRHCPSCQGINKLKWVYELSFDLLPVKYYHAVFTVPSELYDYFRYNKELLYNLLFRSVRETLLVFGKDPRHGIGGKIGAICVLHTWTQQMSYHPHIHCIIPAGGLSKHGNWKHAKKRGNYLFPVRAMSRLYRGKLLAYIHEAYKQGGLQMTSTLERNYLRMKKKLYQKEWVVYNKAAFGGPEQVLEYLGSYTHKICISNYRIIKVDGQYIRFKYQDRKANVTKVKTIRGTTFIRLFAQHVLPKGFVKIRYFGLLASRNKSDLLRQARQSLKVKNPPDKVKLDAQSFIMMTMGKDIAKCPKCNVGEMVITEVFLPIRGSPHQKLNRRFAKNRKVELSC